MSEYWRPIPGHDGYEVSSFGRARSSRRLSNPDSRYIPLAGNEGNVPSRLPLDLLLLGATAVEIAINTALAAAPGLRKNYAEVLAHD